MTNRHYHFVIPKSNIYDYVEAASFTEAKAKAFDEYGPWFNCIEWLDKDDPQGTAASQAGTVGNA